MHGYQGRRRPAIARFGHAKMNATIIRYRRAKNGRRYSGIESRSTSYKRPPQGDHSGMSSAGGILPLHFHHALYLTSAGASTEAILRSGADRHRRNRWAF